ncbi:MAG TPA: hypothetical protein VGE21_09140 [Flavobacteriales bacterium]
MRADDFRLGFILGLIVPVFGFLLYGLMYTTAIRPWLDMRFFVKDMFLGTAEYRAPILSLSLIADAFLFFWFDRGARYRSMRGVIAAMLVYAAVIVICLF